MKVGYSLPLFITRNICYANVIGFVIFGILLPLSTVSYFRFYATLIPEQSSKLPLHFIDPKISHEQHYTVDFYSAYDLKRYKEIDYETCLNLRMLCISDVALQGTVEFKLINELGEEVLGRTKVSVDCTEKSLYFSKNRIIPYNLRFWVSPALTNCDNHVDLKLPIDLEDKIRQRLFYSKRLKLLVTINCKSISVDPDQSCIEISAKWEGLRYLLTKHSLICKVLGILIFWFSSSVVCIFTSLLILNLGQ